MQVDDRQVKEYIKRLSRGKRLVLNIMRSYVNNLAVETQKQSQSNIQKNFKFKNKSSETFIKKGVYYEKAGAGQLPVSEVGAVGNPKSLERKQRRAHILQRQEEGGKVEQVKSSGGKLRKRLVAPDPRFNKNKRTPRLKGNVLTAKNMPSRLIQQASGLRKNSRTLKKIMFAMLINQARKDGLKYALTGYGLYQVMARKKAKRIQLYKPSIKTPKSPWLMPATLRAIAKREEIFKQAFEHRIQEYMGKLNGMAGKN